MTFVILRHQLASIIGRMVHHFQKVNTPSHYSDIIALDDDLLKFVSILPPHFALDPDTSLDGKMHFLPVHRFLLTTEILFVRVILHRPYLLRKLSSDRYLRSRNACFESAIKDFEVRKAFREKMTKETRESLHNAYREFQTAMMSGIYLVLHPHGKDADMMHTILDDFLKDHEGVREMDETTRRELKIIEFLKSRGLQIAESAEQDPHAVNDSQLSLMTSATPTISRHAQSQFSSVLTTTSGPTSPHLYPASPFAQTPTIQRLQHNASTDGTHSSPAGTSSPSGEEESTAQSLLDHWCSTFNDSAVDGPTGMPALSWGGPGGADFAGWVGANANAPVPIDPNLMPTPDGDWNYWENLVSQIKTGPPYKC